MTIKEWLTPDFFALNVILVTLLINMTLFGIASNFTVDGRFSDKTQTATYTTAVVAGISYTVLIILHLAGVIGRVETLYPNKYDFLLMGNAKAFGCIILGLAIGIIASVKKSDARSLRIGLGAGAVVVEALIGAFTVLWIISQQ